MMHEQPECVRVGLYCQACEAEGEGSAPAGEIHNVVYYDAPAPWRRVDVPGVRGGPLRFFACSDACEQIIRAGRR